MGAQLRSSWLYMTGRWIQLLQKNAAESPSRCNGDKLNVAVEDETVKNVLVEDQKTREIHPAMDESQVPPQVPTLFSANPSFQALCQLSLPVLVPNILSWLCANAPCEAANERERRKHLSQHSMVQTLAGALFDADRSDTSPPLPKNSLCASVARSFLCASLVSYHLWATLV